MCPAPAPTTLRPAAKNQVLNTQWVSKTTSKNKMPAIPAPATSKSAINGAMVTKSNGTKKLALKRTNTIMECLAQAHTEIQQL